ncbi:hypothetical protein [Kribbella sindirgiensis]|uniref:Uncharacterized protein n=1 Tax=Kribbella sindirgiensis TaxID=1124744 RepID=A0A4R0I229_9ACTN|nr:hypothetical protein [Kribbella sindirgiensis]TCC19926.1 hypothetical protein E0H50_37475 [Kribbella sindirgiensis]
MTVNYVRGIGYQEDPIDPPAVSRVYGPCPCGNWTLEHDEPMQIWMVEAVEDAMREHYHACEALRLEADRRNAASPFNDRILTGGESVTDLNADNIKRLEQFAKVWRDRRPNSPIIEGMIIDHVPTHLTIDDLEALVKLARKQLPLQEAMRLHETPLWRYDAEQRKVVPESWKQAALG